MKTMAIRLNHTIVAARDKIASANFLTEILGLSPALLVGPFAVIQVGDTSLDYMNVEEYRSSADGDITSQHYAFLVIEAEFDEIFERIRKRSLPYWADPARHESDQINTWDGGRGVYFQDPNGHLLEIITRPYGSAARRRLAPTLCLRLKTITRPGAPVIDGKPTETWLPRTEQINRNSFSQGEYETRC
jgi:catechol 2,3-dioxygenase-like lactoylglutathione lyase family enzyme